MENIVNADDKTCDWKCQGFHIALPFVGSAVVLVIAMAILAFIA